MAIISTSSPAAMNAPFPDHQAWGSPRQWPGNVPSSAIQEVAIMVATDRVRALFADARDLPADALEMLEQGLLRNAAEKAWGATKRATDALALAGPGQDRRGTGAVLRELHWPQDAGIPRPRGTKGTPGTPLLHTAGPPAGGLLLRRPLRAHRGD